MRASTFTLLALPMLLAAAPAADTNEPPRSPPAVAAIKKHTAAVAAAEQAYRQALKAADRDLAKDLDAALKIALKAQDLAEANRIDRKIKAGPSGGAPFAGLDPKGLATELVKHRWFGYRLANHAPRLFELLPDGKVGAGHAYENKWRVASGNTLVIGGDNFESELIRCEDGSFRGAFPTGELMVVYPDPPAAPRP